MIGISGQPSASTARTSGGCSCADERSAFRDEKVSSSLSTASTSSWRATTQRSKAGAYDTGSSRRSCA